jgi:D-3-phosphoglycerate dehydrogenase
MDSSDALVVRLNAELFPISVTERRLLQYYGVRPVEIEAATPEAIIPHVREAHAVCVVSAMLPAEVIDSLDQCRLISRLGNGTDKIDVSRATQRGIVVSNVPDFCTDEMADYVMAMVLSFSREIARMARHMRAGTFRQARAESLDLRGLSTRTLGLVGWGTSAHAVTRRALPFGMTVIATRRDLSRASPEADELGVDIVGLDELLERADYVSLHLPLTTQTRGLLNRERLARMKRGAYFINASRGEIVDEDALAELLHAGYLGGAGIDTYGVIDIFGETEEVPTHPLVTADNVIATPHVSALSVESSRAVAAGSVHNLVSVLGGCMPRSDHIVNRSVVPRFPLEPHDPNLFEED